MKRSLRLGIGVTALALIAAACGGGDNLAEAIINSQTDGANVDISDNGQNISFQDDEGNNVTINTDSEGNVTVESEGGDQQISFGTNAEIPAEFPLPIAPGGTVAFSMSTTEGSTYTITYPKDSFDQLVAMYTEFMDTTTGEQSVSNGSTDGYKWFNMFITREDGVSLSASLSQSDEETVVSLSSVSS
jgi:hypothetical protein